MRYEKDQRYQIGIEAAGQGMLRVLVFPEGDDPKDSDRTGYFYLGPTDTEETIKRKLSIVLPENRQDTLPTMTQALIGMILQKVASRM